ncbi:MAG TPA: M20/M25/M40 family metallo-hydrolase [Pyrinomonadaceae bacterium]|nr:M20/M25/M40 family metallo-hydrolase [Pyrinomonadaceae bacterium]
MRPTQATRIRRLAANILSIFLLCEIVVVTVVRAQPKFAPANSAGVAQQKRGTGRGPSRTATPARNPQISKIVTEIDPRNIERTILKLVSFGTRNTLSDQNDPNRGIGAARDWLYGEFLQAAVHSGGRMTVEKQTFEQPKVARVPQPTMLTNIVATLKGTQPESANRVYVVSGHYDSMCSNPSDAKCDAPGANDDASGTAAVLEMARVMAKYQFDATIVFMTVPGEEQGLLGATHFAEEAKKSNTDIEAMFTNDIIGSSLGGNGLHDPHTVRVFSEGVPSNETPQEAITRRSVGGENDSTSRQLARFIKEVGERYVPSMKVWMIYRRDRYGRGGDHQPFLERGYAAVRFTEPNENYQHQHQNVRVQDGIQYGDLPQFDDFNYIADVARVNAAALAALASAPARPKNVTFPSGLANDTPIKWDANKEPDLAGYEIVWRDTTEATWTHSQSVGNVQTFTMKGMSKDNFFFGVRAVDKEGNRSPVTYPRQAPRAPRTDQPAQPSP